MPIPEPDELNLIRRAQAGDDQAFGKLVDQHTPGLYRVVRRMTSDSAEAEVIVQETFLRSWRALRTWKAQREPGKQDRPFFAYLVTIAVNLARDQWRKTRQLDFRDLDAFSDHLPDSEPGPEKQVEQAEALQALADAVADLPPAYRAVIALRYDAEMSYQEMAAALDLPVNTVRTHLFRAKAQLRQVLENA